MVSVEYREAITEVLEVFKGIKQEDIDKIPKKFMGFLKDNYSKDYQCNFDYNKPIRELELKDETIGILDMICINYWCDTEEKKQRFIKYLKQNEEKYQAELNEKYNTDNLFKSRQPETIIENTEETVLTIHEELPLFKRVFIKIKNIFTAYKK